MPDMISLRTNPQALNASLDLLPIEQKKKLIKQLIEASQKMSGQPTIDAGPGAVNPVNWAEPLGKAIQNFGANQQLNDLNAQEQTVGRQLEGQRQSDVQGYFNQLDGPQGDNSGPLPGNLTADDKANRAASLSQNPEVQKMGLKNAEEMAKQVAELRKKRLEPTTGVQGDQAYRITPDEKDPSKISTNTNALLGYGPMTGATPGMPAGQMDSVGKFHPAGSGQLAQLPATTFNKGMADLDVKTIGEGRKETIDAWTGLNNLGRMETVLNSIKPGTLGTAAGLRVGLNQLGASLGFQVDPNLTNVEQLHSLAGYQLIEKIRALAPVTEEDVRMMRAIVGGTNNTEAALRGIMQYAQETLQRKVIRNNEFAEKTGQKPGYENAESYIVNQGMPPAQDAPIPGGPQAPSIESILQKYPPRGKR